MHLYYLKGWATEYEWEIEAMMEKAYNEDAYQFDKNPMYMTGWPHSWPDSWVYALAAHRPCTRPIRSRTIAAQKAEKMRKSRNEAIRQAKEQVHFRLLMNRERLLIPLRRQREGIKWANRPYRNCRFCGKQMTEACKHFIGGLGLHFCSSICGTRHYAQKQNLTKEQTQWREAKLYLRTAKRVLSLRLKSKSQDALLLLKEASETRVNSST